MNQIFGLEEVHLGMLQALRFNPDGGTIEHLMQEAGKHIIAQSVYSPDAVGSVFSVTVARLALIKAVRERDVVQTAHNRNVHYAATPKLLQGYNA